MVRSLFLVMAFVALVIPACRAEQPASGQQGLPTDTLAIVSAENSARHVFRIEIADTVESRTIGLMFREKMDDDAGMLFVFDEQEERERAFWMKNTLIPLDMVFIHKDGKIGHIHPMARPRDLTRVPSNGPTFSVLEINGGMAARLGIRPGDMVHHKIFGNALAE